MFYTGEGFKELIKITKTLTFDEYGKLMEKWIDVIHSAPSDEAKESLEKRRNQFQMRWMEGWLEDYKKQAITQIKKEIYDLVDYAVHNSTTGSAIHYVSTKELADGIDDILWEEIGHFLLDYDIYQEPEQFGGDWAIDCMFGGYYIPEWDGWEDCY